MKKFNKEDGLYDKNRSIIGSLLSEISWEGSKVTRYRNGGRGLENVLTTEVFQMLYFLPRTFFLGEIIRSLHIKNNETLERLIETIEESEFNLFPGNYYLINEPISHQQGIPVQPDALLITKSVYSLIEVKRIKRGSFQKEQLAREFYLVTREAKEKTPLLIMVLPSQPPVSVSGEGRVDPIEYIKRTLPKVFSESDSHQHSLEELISMVDNHIAWITWEEIYDIINKQNINYQALNRSEKLSINRLCEAILNAIQRHS